MRGLLRNKAGRPGAMPVQSRFRRARRTTSRSFAQILAAQCPPWNVRDEESARPHPVRDQLCADNLHGWFNFTMRGLRRGWRGSLTHTVPVAGLPHRFRPRDPGRHHTRRKSGSVRIWPRQDNNAGVEHGNVRNGAPAGGQEQKSKLQGFLMPHGSAKEAAATGGSRTALAGLPRDNME